jgi:hypothetical protein
VSSHCLCQSKQCSQLSVSLQNAFKTGAPFAPSPTETLMQIELSHDDAELLRDVLSQRVVELEKEISRTDRLAFRAELRKLERSTGRVLDEISSALGAKTLA